MARILILGASGFLGRNLEFFLARDRKLTVQGASRSQRSDSHLVIPAYTESEITRVLVENSIDVVINCVGAVGHEKVDLDPTGSAFANIEIPGLLARATRSLGLRLVHFSSDAVYSGAPEEAPFTEASAPAPFSLYGEQKVQGELQIMDQSKEPLIFRVNFFGWSPGGSRGILDHFVTGAVGADTPIGYTDYFASSLYVGELAKVVSTAIYSRVSGLYNLGSRDSLSKFTFGQEVFKALGQDPGAIIKGNPSVWGSLGITGRDLTMSSMLVESALGIKLPSQEEGIGEALDELEEALGFFDASLDDPRRAVPTLVSH